MIARTDTEMAHHAAQRRARVTIVMAIYFVAGQAIYFSSSMKEPLRTVDHVKISAWLCWAIALMIVLATGGGWFRPRQVRALMNDDVAQANRAIAFMWGFWGAMSACVLLYLLSMFEPLGGREAIHLVLTFGVGAALLRFGVLEKRALKDG